MIIESKRLVFPVSGHKVLAGLLLTISLVADVGAASETYRVRAASPTLPDSWFSIGGFRRPATPFGSPRLSEDGNYKIGYYVADASDGTRPFHAYLDFSGSRIDINEANFVGWPDFYGNPKLANSFAFDVNNSGQVVGSIGRTPSTNPFGSAIFLYQDGTSHLIVDEGFQPVTLLLNSSGTVAGGIQKDEGRIPSYAFIFKDGQLSNISLPGWNHSFVTAINAAGVVVGSYVYNCYDCPDRGIFLNKNGITSEFDDQVILGLDSYFSYGGRNIIGAIAINGQGDLLLETGVSNFRYMWVAADVPESSTAILLLLGLMALTRRFRASM